MFAPHKDWPLVDFLPPQFQPFVEALPGPAKEKIKKSQIQIVLTLNADGSLVVTGTQAGPVLSGGIDAGLNVKASLDVDLQPVASFHAEAQTGGSVTLCAPPFSFTPTFSGLHGSMSAEAFVWKVSVDDFQFIGPIGGAAPCSPAGPPSAPAASSLLPEANRTPSPEAAKNGLAQAPAAPPPMAAALDTSAPALALDAPGNGLVTWVAIPGAGPAVTASELFVAPVTGGVAGAPVQITKDAHGDFDPQVVKLPDGTFLITWERTHTASLPDPGGPTAAFLSDLEIASTIYHPLTGFADPPTFVTNNTTLDHAPHLAQRPNGDIMLVWAANPANVLVGDTTNPDHLMWAKWTGSGWSTPAEALTIPGALSFDLAYGASEAALAFWQVNATGQADISVSRFNGASWSALQAITSDAAEDTAPRVVYTSDGNPFLLWRRDGQLVYKAGSWSAPIVPVGDAQASGSTSGQQLVRLPDGDLLLVWQATSSAGSDLLSRRWFSRQSQWGQIEPLTTDGAERSMLAIAPAATGATIAFLGAPGSIDGLTAPLGLLTADADSDRDGLSDSAEVDIYHTDPLNPSTSGDGYTDGQHVALGKNPLTYCNIMRADVDGDGVVSILDLTRVAQYFTQSVPPAPARYNQDGDSVISILDLTRMANVFTQHVTACP